MGEAVQNPAASCIASGLSTTSCTHSGCGFTTTPVIVPQLVHIMGAPVITAASCTTAGKSTIRCSRENCQHSVDTAIPILPHNWGAWSVIVPATTTSTGTERRTCRNCNHFTTRTIPRKKGGDNNNNNNQNNQIGNGLIVSKSTPGIADALEIFKFLAGMPNVIEEGGQGSRAWNASLITGSKTPGVADALEIFKLLAGMGGMLA